MGNWLRKDMVSWVFVMYDSFSLGMETSEPLIWKYQYV